MTTTTNASPRSTRVGSRTRLKGFASSLWGPAEPSSGSSTESTPPASAKSPALTACWRWSSILTATTGSSLQRLTGERPTVAARAATVRFLDRPPTPPSPQQPPRERRPPPQMRRRVPLVPLPAPRVRDRQPRIPPQAQPRRAQWSPPTLPAPQRVPPPVRLPAPRVPPQVRQRGTLPASPVRWAPLQVPRALPQARQRGTLPALRVPRTPQMLRQQELPPQLAAPVQRTLLLLLMEQRPTRAIAPRQTTA